MDIQLELPAQRLSYRRRALIALALLTPMALLLTIFFSFGTVEADSTQQVPALPDAEGTSREVVAPLAYYIDGTVVNPDGSLIDESTTVYLSRTDADGNCCWEVDTAFAAAADGYFSFTIDTIPSELIPGMFYVSADGNSTYFPSLTAEVWVPNAYTSIHVGHITLTHASFAGSVLTPDQLPSDEGKIRVYTWDVVEELWEQAITTEYFSGTYAIGGVPTGDVLIEADPPEDSLLWHSEPQQYVVQPGDQYLITATQSVTMTLRNPNTTGTIVYPDGLPVIWIMSGPTTIEGSAWITAIDWDGLIDFERRAASSGEFGLLLPPEQPTFEMIAYPDGTLTDQYTHSIPRVLTHTLVPTDTGPYTLTYPSASGFVLNPLEEHVMDCLNIRLEDMSGGIADEQWYCGHEGKPFRLGGVPDGDYWLKAGDIPHLGLFAAEPVFIHVNHGDQYTVAGTHYLSPTLQASQLEVNVHYPGGSIPAPAYVVLADDMGYEEWQTIDAGTPARFGNLAHGDYWVRAWPQTSAIPTVTYSSLAHVYADDTTQTVDLTLRTPNVTGLILTPMGEILPPTEDWDDTPLPYSARVHVHSTDWTFEAWTITNEDGEFSMALPVGYYYALEGYPAGKLAITYTHSLDEHFLLTGSNVTLDPVRLTYPRIVGVVVDPFDQPYATPVDIWDESGTYWDQEPVLWYGPERGEEFHIGGLTAGTYFIRAGEPPVNPEGYGASQIYSFTVGPGSQYDAAATENVTLTLEMANVTGNLLFPLTFTECPYCPVGWVDVRIRSNDGAWSYEDWTTTGEDGRFAFSGVPIGDYWIEFFLPEYMSADWEPPNPEYVQLILPDDHYTNTLYLQETVRNKHLFGDVVDQYGNPIGDENGDALGDARVYAYQENSGQWVDVEADLSGMYDMYLQGGEWIIGVEPTNPDVDWYFADEQRVSFLPDESVENVYQVLTVTRSTFYTVTGVVEGPMGETPPTHSVHVALCTDDGWCVDDRTDPVGIFQIRVIPGTYRIWIKVDPTTGWLPPLHNGAAVVVDGYTDFGIINLRSQDERTVTISGQTIITPTGAAAANVEVAAWIDEGDWTSSWTNASGEYSLNLMPGIAHVAPILTPEQEDIYFVVPPRHRDGDLAAGAVVTDVNFYLRRRDAVIRGALVNEASQVITEPLNAHVFAEICPENDLETCLFVDDAKVQGGTFELYVVGGFTYTVDVWLPTGGYVHTGPISVYVEPGETRSGADLTLHSAQAQIYGSLMDPLSTCIDADATVFAISPDGTWTDDDMWPGKEPNEFHLWVTGGMTWTVGFWVDPATGFMVDPGFNGMDVWVPTASSVIEQDLPVVPIDEAITGRVTMEDEATGIAHVWVYAVGAEATASEGHYFEAQTDASGAFTIPVVAGDYMVSAYVPPHLSPTHFPPQRAPWHSMADNPIDLAFRLRASNEVTINGTLGAIPVGSLPSSAVIHIFGWSEDGNVSEAEGTVSTIYNLTVSPNTIWHLWAVYEDPVSNAYYFSQEKVVTVDTANVTGVNLILWQAGFDLPDTQCWTFDSSEFKRIILPARSDLPAPIIEIPAGTMPVSGTVEICATPRIAVPNGQNLVGFSYELEARDSAGNLITEKFNKKVRLIFYANDDALPTGVDPRTIIPLFYSTSRQEWVPLEDPFIDVDDLMITSKVNHFSRFGLMPSGRGDPNDPAEYIFLPSVLKDD
jgi:hypothetical protein